MELNLKKVTVRERTNKMYLEKFLTAERIQLKCKASDWRDAIRIASVPLLQANDIKPEYVKAMQDAVEEHGPYMCLAEGFALSHAEPSSLVHKECISLITLDPPIEFGNKDFDPIDVLIAFGTPDAKAHMNFLRELCELLNKPDSFIKIREAKTKNEILSLFSTHDHSKKEVLIG